MAVRPPDARTWHPALTKRAIRAYQRAVIVALLAEFCELTIELTPGRATYPNCRVKRLVWRSTAGEVTDEVDVDVFVTMRVGATLAQDVKQTPGESPEHPQNSSEAEHNHLIEDVALELGIDCTPIEGKKLKEAAWIVGNGWAFMQKEAPMRGTAVHEALQILSQGRRVFVVPRGSRVLLDAVFLCN